MKSSLKNITTIQTGVFAKPSSKGEIVYLQTKHFDDNGLIFNILFPDLDIDQINEKHLLKNGDVLFAAKGSNNFAVVYKTQITACVASTTFFVIRILDDIILPEYLIWFLNHPTSQKILKADAIGSSMVSISKKVLEEFEIIIPTIRIQQTIISIENLRIKEKKLKQQLELVRDQQIQHQLLNALK